LGWRAGRGVVADATTAEASSPLTDFLGGLSGPTGDLAGAGGER
jgi:hypothetical protein